VNHPTAAEEKAYCYIMILSAKCGKQKQKKEDHETKQQTREQQKQNK
jgi:hypothetical protein